MKKEIAKLCKAFLLCVIFCLIIAVFVSGMLHANFLSGQRAYLYRLLIMTAICCLLLIVFNIIMYAKKMHIMGIDFITSVMCVGMAGLFMALFFSLGPMVIERSYTVYSLAYLTDYDQPYTYEEIRDQFVTGYVDAGATQKRIDEQVSLGNLEKVNDKYRITQKGEFLISIFRLVETIFPVPDESSIYPKELKFTN